MGKMNELQSIRKRRGNMGEEFTELQLNACGFGMVRPIFTGWKILRWINPQGRIAHVIPIKKVSGDFRAVSPAIGKSVLVEVKVSSPKLSLSSFKEHQIMALTEHQFYGGISLVSWVNPDEGKVVLLQWPVSGLRKGKPLSWDRAVVMDLVDYFINVNGSGSLKWEETRYDL